MAMLAEKRKRTKYCLNPNGNLWTNDESKFGQKILEKMGWQKGQGLGANNQGITERLKVPYKFDSSGLGFKEKDGTLEQQNNFQDLLKELNNDSTENSNDIGTVISLEKKSKESKKRVHYQKFTRGKDISRYSNKDLACILGTETSKPTTKDSSVLAGDYNANQIYGGSINNYFENKKNKTIPSDLNVNTDEDHVVASFENRKRKRGHKKIKDVVDYEVEDQETDCMTQNEAFCSDGIEKSKKKKNQRREIELIDSENQQELEGTSSLHCDTLVTNECFGINNEIREDNAFLENSENNEVNKNNRKHKKRKHKPDVAINSEKIESEHLGDNVDCEVRNIAEFSDDIDYKKLKKRKRKKAEEASESLNESEVNAEELNNSQNFSIDNNVIPENVSIDNFNTRKKNKKHRQILEQNDNTNNYEGNLKTKREREKDSKYNDLQEDIEKIDSSNETVSAEKKRKNNSGIEINGINDEQNLKNNTCEIPPDQIDENDSCIKDESGVKQARKKLRDEEIRNANKLLKNNSVKQKCKNYSKQCNNYNKQSKNYSKQFKNSKQKNQNSVNKFSVFNSKTKTWTSQFKKVAEPQFAAFSGSNWKIINGYGY